MKYQELPKKQPIEKPTPKSSKILPGQGCLYELDMMVIFVLIYCRFYFY